MKKEELSAWLFENGGPVIRYRTATEILPLTKSLDISRLADEMMQSPLLGEWRAYGIRGKPENRPCIGAGIHILDGKIPHGAFKREG